MFIINKTSSVIPNTSSADGMLSLHFIFFKKKLIIYNLLFNQVILKAESNKKDNKNNKDTTVRNSRINAAG